MDKVNNNAIKREIWIDNVKVFACLLVLIGHLLQSMVKSQLMHNSEFYQWFDKTIYMFHVPLFFICSGYLYANLQHRGKEVNWKDTMKKKGIELGIPYFTFSLATWIIKLFVDVNDKSGDLFVTLFLHPLAPYWYLYALFLIFLVTPNFKSQKFCIAFLGISLIANLIGSNDYISIYAIKIVFINEFWFVFGMVINHFGMNRSKRKQLMFLCGIFLFVIFILCSFILFKFNVNFKLFKLALGVMACSGIISIIDFLFRDNAQNKLLGLLSKYTLPIFLMHTIFAAGVRVLLLKLNISNLYIHIIFGFVISIIGPIMAAIIMKISRVLEFFLYPNKFLGSRM